MTDKYELPNYVLSRVRYYDGECLKDDEFVDEQKYHIDRRRRHNRLLHVAGVCDGLLISSANDGQAIRVSSGTAVDDLGREILVDVERMIEEFHDLDGPQWIELLFTEVEDRLADENSAVQAATRFKQAPQLKLSQAATPHAVVLGRAYLSDGKVDGLTPEGRVYSGLRLPGPGGESYALRALDGELAGWAELGCSLRVTGNAEVREVLRASALVVGTALPPAGALDVRVNGAPGWDRFVVTDSDMWGDQGHRQVTIGAGGAAGLLIHNLHVPWMASEGRASIRLGESGGMVGGGFWDVGTREQGAFSLSFNGSGDHKLWVTHDGRTGIGTTEPAGMLDVRLSGEPNWDRFVVGLSDAWEGGAKQYVTIGAGGAAGIMLSNPHVPWTVGDGGRASIRFGRSGGTSTGGFWDVGTRKQNNFSISYNGTENHKLWVTSEGRVGIGTTSPVTQMHVAGTIRADGEIIAQGGVLRAPADLHLYPSSGNGLYIHSDVHCTGRIYDQRLSVSREASDTVTIGPTASTGTSWEWTPGMSLTVESRGANHLLKLVIANARMWVVSFRLLQPPARVIGEFRLILDGSQVQYTAVSQPNLSSGQEASANVQLEVVLYLSPGAHTLGAQWSIYSPDGGVVWPWPGACSVAMASYGSRQLWAIEQ